MGRVAAGVLYVVAMVVTPRRSGPSYDFGAFLTTRRSARDSCFASRRLSAAMMCLVASLTIRTVPSSSRATLNCR